MADLREKVARSIYEKRNGPGCLAWAHLKRSHQDPYLSAADAAIAVCMEEAAKVAERAGGSPVGAADGCGTHIVGSALDAAAALRALRGEGGAVDDVNSGEGHEPPR